jgi:hypothetical protein
MSVACHRPFRWPGRLAPLLLSVGTSAVLLLIVAGAELLARWSAPDYLARTRGFHVFSETYGWAPRQGASVVIDGKRVTFSARGFRGHDLPIPKAGDRTRVVVLGDSIAFGLDVSDDETFTHVLDARDNGIEAANLAVQGYGPDQELLVLMNEGLRLDPDVVVLAFCLANDLADAVLPVSLYDGRTPKPRFRLVGDRLVLDDEGLRLSAWQRVHQWIADYSQLANRASALVQRREPPLGPHWRERYDGALRDEAYALRLSLALVERMDAVCRERGIKFLVAAFPDRDSYKVKPRLAKVKPRLAKRFLRSLDSDGIQVIDMSVPFRAAGTRFKTVALDGAGHLNPFGHTLTAEFVEAYIRRPREAHVQSQP